IAVALISIDPSKYGFNDVEYGKPIEYDRVIIKAAISMDKVASLCNADVETIRDLNTQLLSDLTPVFDDGYLIKIPKGFFKEFSKNYKDADDFEKYGFNPIYDGNEGTSSINKDESYSYFKVSDYHVEDKRYIISSSNRELVFHSLAETEDLYNVSLKYEVRPTDLRLWNNIMYGNYPKQGDKLSVWLTKAKYKELYGVKQESIEENRTEEIKDEKKDVSEKKDNTEKTVLVNKENRTNENNTEKKEEKNTDVKKDEKKSTDTKKRTTDKTTDKKKSSQTYTVKEGDNLTEIADNFDVDVSDIKEWNGLESDKIMVGQKLKIYSDKKITSSSKKAKTYTVKSGDNLTKIAEENNVS